jgi:hypothetical protein
MMVVLQHLQKTSTGSNPTTMDNKKSDSGQSTSAQPHQAAASASAITGSIQDNVDTDNQSKSAPI